MLERHLVERDRQFQRRDPAQAGCGTRSASRPGRLLTHALATSGSPNPSCWPAFSRARSSLSGCRNIAGSQFSGARVQDDAPAGLDGLTGDLDVVQRNPALSVLDDGQVSHQFLDRVGDTFGSSVLRSRSGLLRVLQQRQDADADHVGRRLMSGDQQAGSSHGLPGRRLTSPPSPSSTDPDTASLGRAGLLLLEPDRSIRCRLIAPFRTGVLWRRSGRTGVWLSSGRIP